MFSRICKFVLIFVFSLSSITGVSNAKVGPASIHKIAIFNEKASWTDAASAKKATDFIMKNVDSVSSEIKVYNDADIAGFAKENTDDGNLDIIITFGYFPVSLYTPGNTQKEDSLAEQFLEGGDMFINTADYIFYVTEGGGKNGENGLKTITDSTFDMWGDGNSSKPTADGKKYTPSLKAFSNAQRPFKVDQIKADKNWEVEVVFGDNDGGGGSMADPIIIRHKEHNGRVCIAFQTGVPDPIEAIRGKVIHEIIDNYLKLNVIAVDPVAKIAAAWGDIKKGSIK